MRSRRVRVGFLGVLLFFALAPLLQADGILLYVDAAPNIYGSPQYPSWEANTFAAVSHGTFVNMSDGISAGNVGTTNFMIQDEVVYSFGDLGYRLTWIYWVPGETIADLELKNFQISLFNTWDGDVEDFYLSYYGSTWLTPTSWIDYTNPTTGETGVIGTAGMAWWGAHNTNTPAELAEDIASWITASETWVFTVRMDSTSDVSITSNRLAVPEPSLILLLGIGLGAVTVSASRWKM